MPGEVLDDLDLNAQRVLLETARSFDDQHRKPEAPPSAAAPSTLERRLKVAGLAPARADEDG